MIFVSCYNNILENKALHILIRANSAIIFFIISVGTYEDYNQQYGSSM